MTNTMKSTARKERRERGKGTLRPTCLNTQSTQYFINQTPIV